MSVYQCWAKFRIEFHSHNILELRLNWPLKKFSSPQMIYTHACDGTAASPLLSVPPRPLNCRPSPGSWQEWVWLGNNQDWRRMMRHTWIEWSLVTVTVKCRARLSSRDLSLSLCVQSGVLMGPGGIPAPPYGLSRQTCGPDGTYPFAATTG